MRRLCASCAVYFGDLLLSHSRHIVLVTKTHCAPRAPSQAPCGLLLFYASWPRGCPLLKQGLENIARASILYELRFNNLNVVYIWGVKKGMLKQKMNGRPPPPFTIIATGAAARGARRSRSPSTCGRWLASGTSPRPFPARRGLPRDQRIEISVPHC